MSVTSVDTRSNSTTRIRTGSVFVYTFKAGLLARAAHDLRLSVHRFEIETDGDSVLAEMAVESIRVDGVMRDGSLDRTALDPGNVEEIERNLRGDILHAREHPLLRYRGWFYVGTSRIEVDGALELRGESVALPFHLEAVKARLRGGVELQPSRWGIAPYKALFGAIHLQDRLVVEFDLPDPRAGEEGSA